jgi:glycerol-3-phosphate acyltransferase PlsY
MAYAIASIPFGLLVVHRIKDADIRKLGSGNIGATNVRRIMGTKAGLFVLVCDVLKGLLPLLAVGAFYQTNIPETRQWIAVAMALAAITGHIYPCYLKFKASGKGVATALGVYIYLVPSACIISLVLFLVSAALTRRVSVGSITAILALPPVAWITGAAPLIVVGTVISSGLMLLRHRDNIKRLRQGIEPPVFGPPSAPPK